MGKIRPIMIKGHERALTMIKYNRDGDLIFSCSKDHVPSVWYSENGERIGTYHGHCGTVWCLDVNWDSTKLLSGSADNCCKLWEVQSGECLHTWKHTAPVRCVGFAMGDKRFLTVLDNIMGNVPTIYVWELELNNLANHPDCPLLTILGHTGKIGRALWGPLNEAIYSVSDDSTLRMWDPDSGEEKHVMEGVHTKKITDLQLSYDKTLLCTSCTDQFVRLFETKTLRLLYAFNSERPLNSAAISPLPHCPYLIAGGGQDAMSVTTTAAQQGKFETLFFDHAFGEELGCIGGHFGPVNTLAFAPHGRSYASGGEDGYIRIHHLDQEYFEAYEKKVTESGILAADKA
ncbi:hypothetical protein EMIHUDRAFT_438175 [Emiliania huxleyi CCMP1516]|uniref:Eukaryotic translation initiation factor 3 subunit I n=2 Tax=Emiliania huxleyi TaxID=2903 RepID=A0A0D3ICS3_EMIH1|nr:hypothetical protein EMIHUDRAFT_438175 [Emiliania huxleyi CCMP1516]EOD09058.1 hypothetical protein EMIHUDRAFT_438175 [Emiliania huxleyi CCMP1516]|eukprot:XP_005761487.1 hypothetical protein EMIHUDRAFT_438175 [Emiliania huxleyi CCMP1516]